MTEIGRPGNAAENHRTSEVTGGAPDTGRAVAEGLFAAKAGMAEAAAGQAFVDEQLQRKR